jgi:mRNA-degrading endonuclease RelE of RelBE toxin-antitoxin system
VPTIKLLKRAELELFDACEWYEKQQKGLSARLRKEVREALSHLQKTPEAYAVRFNADHRFIHLKKFPFELVYWNDENLNTIFVTSVFHTKRNPEKFES